jgi:hypothetical protein
VTFAPHQLPELPWLDEPKPPRDIDDPDFEMEVPDLVVAVVPFGKVRVPPCATLPTPVLEPP